MHREIAMLVGTGLGLGLLVGLPGIVLSRDIEAATVLAAYGIPLAVLALGFLLGMLFGKTIGVAAQMGWPGALIAAVLALFTSQIAYAPPLLLLALFLFWLTHMMHAREIYYREYQMAKYSRMRTKELERS